MDQSVATHQTQINHLWDTINTTHVFSLDGPDSPLSVFTQLINLIDVTNSPQDYCRALRKRAQFCSLAARFDDALIDLRVEWDIARKHNLNHLIEDIECHIARLSVWRKLEL